MDQSVSAGAVPLPDRRRALVVWGWVLIVSGVVFGLLALFVLLAVVFSPALAVPAASLGLNIAMYLVIGAVLVALGIGSIRVRRWARALTLIVAWTWLATGVFCVVAMAFVIPDALSATGATRGVMTCVFAGMVLGAAVFAIALPLLLALFYGREDVRYTFESRDPVPGWTEKLPPSLLGIVLVLALGGFFSLLSPLFLHAVPMFGTIWTGFPAVALVLVMGGITLILAAGVWRRSMAAWWGLIAFQVFGLVNGLTLRRLDMPTLLRASGYPDSQIRGAPGANFMTSAAFLVVLGGAFVATTAFLVAVRRQFRR